MAVNWVRFPWCSAGPTSGDVISSNISRNHSTVESPPFSARFNNVLQCCTTPRPPTLLCNLQLYMNVALSKAKTSAYVSVQTSLHTLTIFELKWVTVKQCWCQHSSVGRTIPSFLIIITYMILHDVISYKMLTKLFWSQNSIFPKKNYNI